MTLKAILLALCAVKGLCSQNVVVAAEKIKDITFRGHKEAALDLAL